MQYLVKVYFNNSLNYTTSVSVSIKIQTTLFLEFQSDKNKDTSYPYRLCRVEKPL